MLKADENRRLTQVGPGTPMGQVFRNYWLPACLSGELEPGGGSKLVELLGERMVVFRSPGGEVGVVDEACPHRGASLLLARNEECGLRCIYHGWQVDRDGRLVDAPTNRDPERMAQVVRHGAYPVVERGGVVWTHLGRPDQRGPFRAFKWAVRPPSHVQLIKVVLEANWAQAMESLVDSAHVNYLHADLVVSGADADTAEWTGTGQVRNTADGAPQLEIEDTAYGFRYGAIRQPLAGADTHRYVRTTVVVAPSFVCIASPSGRGHFEAYIPMSDRRTMFYSVHYRTDGPFEDEDRRGVLEWYGARPGVDVDDDFRKVRNRENGWLQDRERMRLGASYTGLFGILNQDHAAVESMGPIVDRTKEHLGPTDVAVIRFRRMMLRAAKAVENGGRPIGADEDLRYETLDAAEGLVRLDAPWQEVISDGLAGAGAGPSSATRA